MPIRRSSPDGSASGFEGAYEGRRILPGFMDTKTRSLFLPFFFEVCIVGSAFSMAQGLITSATLPIVTSKMKLKLLSLRGARVGMERVGHTATTIATSLLKSTQVTDLGTIRDLDQFRYEAHQKKLQRRVLRHADVDSRCEEAALRLTKMYPIAQHDCLSQPSSQLGPVSRPPMEKNVDIEQTHFFESFSLEMEMEFRTSCSKNKPPSLAAQKVVTKIRMILENLIDEHQLDPFRSPIVHK
ncbi:unnamed protein product [Fusarium langsethiae]|nr:unnamed protein product [Fusarium langsethiae]